MPTTIKFRIGGTMIEVTSPTLKEAIDESSVYAETPKRCGLCHKEDLAFSKRRVQKYEFFQLVCRDCGAEYAFGVKHADGSLYPKGPWAHPPRSRAADLDARHEPPTTHPPHNDPRG